MSLSMREESRLPPPRRPMSTPDLKAERLSRGATPPYLPPRRPKSVVTASPSRASSIRRDLDSSAGAEDTRPWTASSSLTQVNIEDTSRHNSLASPRQSDEDVIRPVPHAKRLASGPVRHSSLRFESSLARGSRKSLAPAANMANNPQLDSTPERPSSRPRSHPPPRSNYFHNTSPTGSHPPPPPPIPQEDPWQLPSLQQPSISRSSSQHSTMLRPKPKPSFTRLQSLDNLITYREEKAEWKRASSFLQSPVSDDPDEQHPLKCEPTIRSEPETLQLGHISIGKNPDDSAAPSEHDTEDDIDQQQPKRIHGFRNFATEIGFCFTIAMTQFLAEYMISGFAIELPKILSRYNPSPSPTSMGIFWPASLLSLILSATLLIFARISDMYGGYLCFMFGVIWLGLWSLLAGFAKATILLDVSRAMQGLAIAAFIPSTFAMTGAYYEEGARKNFVLGLYAGCAPLGFFAGVLVAGALPEGADGWYFWIAAGLAFMTAVTAYLTVPHDQTERRALGLEMDWIGSVLITGGLILVAYALAVEPYANKMDVSRSGWTFPMVLAPLVVGLACLVAAFFYEGWGATCPLLPFDFFYPKSVTAFSLACLCFYASYGVWLYESAQFFASEAVTGVVGGIEGLLLAAWYTPTAIGGLALCILGGTIVHRVPVMTLLLLSAFAWIAAPLLLALCPFPIDYWAYVMPSMLCATIGIDLTFTVSTIFLSSVSPKRYQGLAGAVSSILVNLGMSFSLSISEIVTVKAESMVKIPEDEALRAKALAKQETWGYQASFIYAASSACLGLIIVVLCVRVSRLVVNGSKKVVDVERPRATSSEVSTLVDLPRQ